MKRKRYVNNEQFVLDIGDLDEAVFYMETNKVADLEVRTFKVKDGSNITKVVEGKEVIWEMEDIHEGTFKKKIRNVSDIEVHTVEPRREIRIIEVVEGNKVISTWIKSNLVSISVVSGDDVHILYFNFDNEGKYFVKHNGCWTRVASYLFVNLKQEELSKLGIEKRIVVEPRNDKLCLIIFHHNEDMIKALCHKKYKNISAYPIKNADRYIKVLWIPDQDEMYAYLLNGYSYEGVEILREYYFKDSVSSGPAICFRFDGFRWMEIDSQVFYKSLKSLELGKQPDWMNVKDEPHPAKFFLYHRRNVCSFIFMCDFINSDNKNYHNIIV